MTWKCPRLILIALLFLPSVTFVVITSLADGQYLSFNDTSFDDLAAADYGIRRVVASKLHMLKSTIPAGEDIVVCVRTNKGRYAKLAISVPDGVPNLIILQGAVYEKDGTIHKTWGKTTLYSRLGSSYDADEGESSTTEAADIQLVPINDQDYWIVTSATGGLAIPGIKKVVLFSDDFEDGTIYPWETYGTGECGIKQENGNHMLYEEGPCFAEYGGDHSLYCGDFALRLSLKIIRGTFNINFCVLSSERYFLLLDSREKHFLLQRQCPLTMHNFETLTQGDLTLPYNIWHNIEVSLAGLNVLFYVDKEAQLNYNIFESSYYQRNCVFSLETRPDYPESYAFVDDVEVTKLSLFPIAKFTYSPSNPREGSSIRFDASSSNDPDGSIAKYEWDFGDGSKGSGRFAAHVYNRGGSYTVTLFVTDNDGITTQTTQTVFIEGRDLIQADFSFRVIDEALHKYHLDASSSIDTMGEIVRYEWDWDSDGSYDTAVEVPEIKHRFSEDGPYEVTLTIVDDQGNKAICTKEVAP